MGDGQSSQNGVSTFPSNSTSQMLTARALATFGGDLIAHPTEPALDVSISKGENKVWDERR